MGIFFQIWKLTEISDTFGKSIIAGPINYKKFQKYLWR